MVLGMVINAHFTLFSILLIESWSFRALKNKHINVFVNVVVVIIVVFRDYERKRNK